MKNLLIFFSLLFTTQLVAQNVTNAEAADKAFQAGIMEGSILQGFVDDPLTIRIVDPANHGDLDATGLQNAANVTVTYNRIIAALTADFGDLPRLIAQADSLNALADSLFSKVAGLENTITGLEADDDSIPFGKTIEAESGQLVTFIEVIPCSKGNIFSLEIRGDGVNPYYIKTDQEEAAQNHFEIFRIK